MRGASLFWNKCYSQRGASNPSRSRSALFLIPSMPSVSVKFRRTACSLVTCGTRLTVFRSCTFGPFLLSLVRRAHFVGSVRLFHRYKYIRINQSIIRKWVNYAPNCGLIAVCHVSLCYFHVHYFCQYHFYISNSELFRKRTKHTCLQPIFGIIYLS